MFELILLIVQPPVIIVVLKVYMHCEACAMEIKKRIQRMKGMTFFCFFLFFFFNLLLPPFFLVHAIFLRLLRLDGLVIHDFAIFFFKKKGKIKENNKLLS